MWEDIWHLFLKKHSSAAWLAPLACKNYHSWFRSFMDSWSHWVYKNLLLLEDLVNSQEPAQQKKIFEKLLGQYKSTEDIASSYEALISDHLGICQACCLQKNQINQSYEVKYSKTTTHLAPKNHWGLIHNPSLFPCKIEVSSLILKSIELAKKFAWVFFKIFWKPIWTLLQALKIYSLAISISGRFIPEKMWCMVKNVSSGSRLVQLSVCHWLVR